MVCWSAVIHLALFFLLVNFNFPARFKEAPVYYVDLLDLPVANPQAGTPGSTRGTPAPPPPAPSQPRQMTLPTKAAQKAAPRQVAATQPKQTDAAESAREYEERLARLEQEASARHATAAIDALRKKAGGKGTAGMPGAAGTEAGSDYPSYIQSRLRDAFTSTIAFQHKNPEVAVRITISRTGRVSRVRLERSTGDKVFEDAVTRAIAKAEQTFPPPPRGEEFESGFVFRPQGVGKN